MVISNHFLCKDLVKIIQLEQAFINGWLSWVFFSPTCAFISIPKTRGFTGHQGCLKHLAPSWLIAVHILAKAASELLCTFSKTIQTERLVGLLLGSIIFFEAPLNLMDEMRKCFFLSLSQIISRRFSTKFCGTIFFKERRSIISERNDTPLIFQKRT